MLYNFSEKIIRKNKILTKFFLPVSRGDSAHATNYKKMGNIWINIILGKISVQNTYMS